MAYALSPSRQPPLRGTRDRKGPIFSQSFHPISRYKLDRRRKIQEPLLKAVRKGEETENQNLHYIWMDVEWLNEVFGNGEINRLYLHFSDPWPKKRHTKRRLTHHRFLERYRKVLAPGGDLILKTDSVSLFDFSLEEFAEYGWETVEMTRDLHNSPFQADNITTEYEEKFVARGLPIHYIRVKPV